MGEKVLTFYNFITPPKNFLLTVYEIPDFESSSLSFFREKKPRFFFCNFELSNHLTKVTIPQELQR